VNYWTGTDPIAALRSTPDEWSIRIAVAQLREDAAKEQGGEQ
jgi:hypothetical protein